jgi:hypothetical protein
MSVHATSKPSERIEPVVRPTCATCPFWDMWSDSDPILGLCRVDAPRMPTDPNQAELWPLTHDDAWCGRHPGMAAYLKSRGF